MKDNAILDQPMSEAAASLYRAISRENEYNLTEEDIQSLRQFEFLDDSMAPQLGKGARLMAVKRSLEALPQIGRIVVVYTKSGSLYNGRLKEITESTITLSSNNPVYVDQVFERVEIERVYEGLWFSGRIPDMRS